MAVSGLHVSILGGTLYKGSRRLGIPFWCAVPTTVGFLLCYQEMLGFRCSAFRAVAMFVVLLGAQVTGRAYDRLTALMLTLAVLVAGRPMLVLTGGFWLSAVATLGAILGVERKAEERRTEKEKLWKNEEERGVPVKNRKKEWAKKLWDGISVVFFIQLITLPVQLYVFYELAVYGLLWNLLLVPAAPLILGAGIVALLLSGLWMPLGVFAGGTSEVLLMGFELAGRIGKMLPGAVYVCGKPEIWQVMVYYLMLALWLWSSWPGKEKRVHLACGTGFLLAGVLLIFVRFHAPLEVTFLDVGQGDCAVVRESGGLCMMVDCGSSDVDNVWAYRVLPFLKHEKVTKLDYVFVSHGDADHISGLLELFRRGDVPVAYLVCYENAGEKLEELKWLAQKQGTRLLELAPGNVLRSENIKITCVGPAKEDDGASENERSLVFSLESRGVTFLFTGDMEGEGEKKLLDSSLADSLRADVLKVAHHGSRESTSKELLSRIQPELAVISCGKDNRYGHPHKETVERLTETGADIVTTPEEGAVKVAVKGGNNRSNRIVKPTVILYNKFR